MRGRHTRGFSANGLFVPARAGLLALCLAGCAGQASPAQPMFGAYFPFWLICAAVGILGAVLARVLFIRIGLDEVLPWRLAVYSSLAAAIGFVLAFAIYGR